MGGDEAGPREETRERCGQQAADLARSGRHREEEGQRVRGSAGGLLGTTGFSLGSLSSRSAYKLGPSMFDLRQTGPTFTSHADRNGCGKRDSDG
jgi:hypothetical protein